tara:strand:+ start:117 stop:395 length:279 start_codon:yes stop_codon:yes gene_type:complete
MVKKTKLPISLLRLVESGNEYKKPIFGGGFMNGPEMIPVLVAWEAAKLDKTKTVSTYNEYLNYQDVEEKVIEPVEKKVSKVVRKKKVAAAHG